MYFTLLFETNHGPTEIFELFFHPAVVWMKYGKEVCQPHHGPYLKPDRPSVLPLSGTS